ncbi:ankyrin repeat and SAM domain-containing protein 6 [Lingula anatina]|uniref:Ankyrin repeat and SAM domain-containing protein 6 n=1 Tax=Lingula anatina TaxID=7574 RepID=A0A1S3H1F0_LINAN|nr:ankyrin repeat and SAM domain-containing protein 6 [Lingula anatina]|eukprot:XP_013379306.1 ankyrin repeat and SAM domain-containing protein 6 [Lingula anatina]
MDQIRQMLALCEQGDMASVVMLLDQGPGVEVDSADDEGTTPLAMAAANGHEQLVKVLLMKGAALDKPNNYRWTPIMHAARHGHTNVVSLLLQNKCDLYASNKLHATALTLAARGGYIQTVRLLVESGIDLNSCGTSCEFTPLMAAAQYGHDVVVRYLLDRGSDVNYRMPSTGLNALMLAAVNGHMTTAQILIERGCDPNLTNANNHTALEIASQRRKREVKGYLDRKTTNKPSAEQISIKPDIIEATKNGNLQRVKEILDEDISQVDAFSPGDGATPLMFAAMTGRMDIAQLLVEKGSDVNKQDCISGWTAIMQALYHGKKAMAKYLIGVGADVSLQAKNGCTAFDMASLIDDVDTELLRVLASKMMGKQDNKQKSKTMPAKNGALSNIEQGAEEEPKSGLKAWWNRMSNRFRNLRLGHTFRIGSNRLAPMPENAVLTDDTLRGNTSPKGGDSKVKGNGNTPGADPSLTLQSVDSFETIMLESKKNAFTLGINSNLPSETLKPVIPPFFPPPTFEMDNSDRRMPLGRPRSMVSLDTAGTTTPSRPYRPNTLKFLNKRPVSSISPSPVSPSSSGRYSYNNPSPGSSGGGSMFGQAFSRARLPASVSLGALSTVHQHGEYLGKSGSSGASSIHLTDVNLRSSQDNMLYLPATHHLPPVKLTALTVQQQSRGKRGRTASSPGFLQTSGNSSSTSGSSAQLTPRKPKSKSTSSRGSTTSTLTPSPSPTPGKQAKGPSAPSSGSRSSSSNTKTNPADPEDQGDLGGILKKLSLERYQPIFEEQEVDMEAFLTLSDADLQELGIDSNEPRKQILSAISELNSGKGRERRRLHETMTNFQNTFTDSGPGSSGGTVGRWSLQEEPGIRGETSAKSRAS